MENYKPAFASDNLLSDVQRIKEFRNVKYVRIIHSGKTEGITVTFGCENTHSGNIKEYTFSPWNVKFKSGQFYLDNPLLWFFDNDKDCYEDSIAFTLACMKALSEKGIEIDLSMFYNPAELVNELMKAFPANYIEF